MTTDPTAPTGTIVVMHVYAVMRGRAGKELHGLYLTPELAEQRAEHLNEAFPRGHRYTVVTLPVEGPPLGK